MVSLIYTVTKEAVIRTRDWRVFWLLVSLAPTTGAIAHADDRRDGDDSDRDRGRQETCPPAGVIAETLVITENGELACDVVCTNATGPCIQFGDDHLTLWLNGFTMTGPASPPSNCAPSPVFSPGNPGPFPYDGISTAGFDHVRVLAPGMVQPSRRFQEDRHHDQDR